jgi:hypothetical protein
MLGIPQVRLSFLLVKLQGISLASLHPLHFHSAASQEFRTHNCAGIEGEAEEVLSLARPRQTAKTTEDLQAWTATNRKIIIKEPKTPSPDGDHTL